jgi:hypothetical protein
MSNKQEPNAEDELESLPESAFVVESGTNPQSLGGAAATAAKRPEHQTHTTPHSLGSPEKS